MFLSRFGSFALSFCLGVVLIQGPRLRAQSAPAGPGTGQSKPHSTTVRLTLAEAINLALKNNQTLRAERLKIDESKADEITASLKPNPVFTSSNEDFRVFSPSQLNWENLKDNQEFLQSIGYTFERGDKRRKRMTVAKDATDVTAEEVRDTERQLRFQVAQTFIEVLLARSKLDFAQQNLKDFLGVIDVNKSRLDAGDISEADFLKITLQKLQFQQDVSAARLELVQTRAALRQLLGYRLVPEDFELAGKLEHKKYEVTLKDLEAAAVQERPDLSAAHRNVKLARDAVTLAYGNRARDFDAEWEFKRNGNINGVGFNFSFELPFNDRNQGEIARSKVALRQAEQGEAAAQYTVMTDVESAFAGLQTSQRVLSLYESGYLGQATRSRDISRYAYQRGAANLLEMLDAERSYRDTQLAFRQALADYMTNAEQINFVVGQRVMK